MEPRKKASPQGLTRPADVGLAPRALAAQRIGSSSARLPTAAALHLALLSSMLVGGAMLGGCGAASGEEGGIQADVARRPVVHPTETVTSASAPVAPAVSAPIEPVPHAVKGEMAPVRPIVGIPTPTAKSPPPVGSAAPVPTSIPRAFGGKPSSVRPTFGATGKPSLGTVPCERPAMPETS